MMSKGAPRPTLLLGGCLMLVAAAAATAAGFVARVGGRVARRGSFVARSLDGNDDGDDDPFFLPGKRKWLGGAVSPDGSVVYGVPAHAHSVLRLEILDDDGSSSSSSSSSRCRVDLVPVPAAHRKRRFKWLRGVLTDSHLFGIPAWADGVLRVNLDAAAADPTAAAVAAEVLPAPPGAGGDGRWSWHGAAAVRDEDRGVVRVYCAPANADKVLKIVVRDDDDDRVEFAHLDLPPDDGRALRNKWYGAVSGANDRYVYGVPYAAGSILRVDARTDEVVAIGRFGEGAYNWHGGARAGDFLFAFPSHSDRVLRVDTTVDDPDACWSLLDVDDDDDGSRRPSGRYKWGGGCVGADGRVYGVPSDADRILRVDPVTGACDATLSCRLLPNIKNKWQGGVLSPANGRVYAVPANADAVLRVDTRPGIDDDQRVDLLPIEGLSETATTTTTTTTTTTDKWQGAFLARDGNVYAIPENSDRILRIVVDGVDGTNCHAELLTS